jgi:hypothetical protein
MADDGFNGATLLLDSVALGPILSINASDSAPEVDTTGSADSAATSAGGVPKLTISVEILGGTTASPNDTGALAVAWLDIGTSTLGTETTARVSSVSTSGSKDQPTTTTIEFVKAAPTA